MGEPELDDWVARIRDRDPATFEGAYEGERPAGPAVVPRLLAEMRRAADGYTRGKFLELLGEMGDQSVVPAVAAELGHTDPEVRRWAVLALGQLGGPEAESALTDHRAACPEDFA